MKKKIAHNFEGIDLPRVESSLNNWRWGGEKTVEDVCHFGSTYRYISPTL